MKAHLVWEGSVEELACEASDLGFYKYLQDDSYPKKGFRLVLPYRDFLW